MVYLAWLVILLIPYWLGPIVVWVTQRAGARPAFEPFTLGRHAVPEDVAAAFRQTCDALSTEGFHVVADLFQSGQMKHVSTRVATGGRSRSTTVPFQGRSRRRRPASSCRCRSCRTRRGCAASRVYLERHYRGVERAPFEHQDEPARFLGGAMVRELTEQVEAGAWRRSCRT